MAKVSMKISRETKKCFRGSCKLRPLTYLVDNQEAHTDGKSEQTQRVLNNRITHFKGHIFF